MTVRRHASSSRNRPQHRRLRILVLSSAGVLAFVPACVGVREAKGQTTWDTKRGSAGVPLGQNGATLDIAQPGATAGANALNSRWLYTWGNTPPADVTSGTYNGEYVPMIWSASTSTYQTTVTKILGYASSLNVKYVLGFNEPERSTQANMSVANAITIWDGMDNQFKNAGIKLVSPAVSDDSAGTAWMASFMSTATARGLTVDAIAFHWYGNINLSNPTATANSFLGRVDYYWNTYQKPIWITEFAGMDWNGTVSTPDLIAFNTAFLKAAVAGLESRSYVQRYSWWQYGNSANGGLDDTKLIDVTSNVYTPTAIGDSYVPSYGTGSGLDLNGKTPGKTIFYLEGGSLTNSSGGALATVSSVDATSGTSTFGGAANWNIQQGYLRVRAGAALSKVGSSQLTLSSLKLDINSDLVVTAGQIEIGASNTFASGTGTFRISGGTLLISGVANGMSNPIVIQSGGTVIMDSADASTMSSTFTVQSGGTLQVGKLSSTTNVFSNSPTLISNAGSVIVYANANIANMTGAGSLVAGNGELQSWSNSGFTGAISVGSGTFVPRDATAFGTSAGITTISGDQATGGIVLKYGFSTGAEPITILARQGATIDTPQILNSAGTNTIAGSITLGTGGSDWNLRSDAGLLSVTGSIVASPNTLSRNLKLLGSSSGSFSGSVALDPGATNSLVKNGTGSWTMTGSVSGVGTVKVLQGRLALGGSVSGGSASVTSVGELAFVGSGSANKITGFTGAGTISFSGNTTNVLTGIIATTGLLTVGPGQVTTPSNSASGYTTLLSVQKLSITSNGRIIIPARSQAYAGVVDVNQLGSLSGVIDLTNNDMIVSGSSLTSLRFSISNNRIMSSMASPNAAPYTTLALFSNLTTGTNAYFSTYDGVPVVSSDLIIKYTYVGDTNLDGVLDGRDLANVLEGYSTGQSGWYWGDADNSGGAITQSDVTAVLTALNYYQTHVQAPLGSGLADGDAAPGAIPEPSELGLLSGLLSLVCRRRRSGRLVSVGAH